MTQPSVTVRFLFADEGAFHQEDLTLPSRVVDEYDRLIDGLREDPEVLKRIYLDLGRLTAAWVEDSD
jgi:hypothetical protein